MIDSYERAFKGVWIPADVWLCNELCGIQKLVLFALAGNADDKGTCCVSYEDIAVVCSTTKRTAQRHIKQLVRAGFVEKFCPGDNYANVYTLTIAKGDVTRLGGVL